MNAYVKDTNKALKEIGEWIGDIEGVLHPDLFSKIENLINEAEQLVAEHESVVGDLESAKQALEENGIEL